MANFGPVAVFVLYMALSAWAKKKKAQARQQQTESEPAAAKAPRPPSAVQSILEQLKRDMMAGSSQPATPEFQEESFIPDEPVPEPEPEPVTEPAVEPVFVEGEDGLTDDEAQAQAIHDWGREKSGASLEFLLSSYSHLERGIVLREILGKPRALQDKKEWFHSSL